MPFLDVMERVLPTQNGTAAHVTGDYGESRLSGPHGGVDFNYLGGQSGLNLTHPPVHAPISGEVTFVGGQYGTIKIRDTDGNSHEILHTDTQSVAVDSQVNAGDVIGTMGGRGPNGASQYAQHVHYQMKTSAGSLISPQQWWADRSLSETTSSSSRFVYPFQTRETSSDGVLTTAEVVDPQTYYSALANAEDGFYPIGANGQWHGGIHFGSQTDGVLAQDAGIRCIADGEVIAYRIDGVYPKVSYDSCGEATYSTGFTLVRHRLQLPPAPNSSKTLPTDNATTPTPPPPVDSALAGAPLAATSPFGDAREHRPTNAAAASPQNNPEEPSLVLYSLYMHLSDWKGYQDDPEKPRPTYWCAAQYLVGDAAAVADRVKNPHIPEGGIGLNLRDAHGKIVGFAPREIKLRLGAEGRKKGYYVVSGVAGGDVIPSGLTDAYAYKKELTETTADPDTAKIVVLQPPAAVRAGDLMGYLGQYQRSSDTNPMGSNCSTRALVQLDVFTGEDVADFIGKSRERAEELGDRQKTLLLIEAGAKLALPIEADQQIPATDGITLDDASPKEGDWVKVRTGTLEIVAKSTLSGYQKATQRYSNGSVLSRILDAEGNAIKLEGYNALADKSAYTQREIMVPSGDSLWVQRSMLDDRRVVTGRMLDAWSRFPLQVRAANGPEAAYPRVAVLKTVDNSVLEADGTRWWQVEVGTSAGTSGTGWAREKDHPKVKLCTSWHWPGFELVTPDATPPATFYANHVSKQPRTPNGEQADLETAGASAETAPLFTRLYELMDQDGDQTLITSEIRKALKKSWLAQAISRVITRYDTEWAGPMDKWDALDPLIPEHRRSDWTEEKKRIESLLWWDDVQAVSGFPATANVTHFHPIGLISLFSAPCPQDCMVDYYELQTPNGKFLVSKKSFEDMLSDETYKEHPYVPAAISSSSGITVGYGYDLGHQTGTQITEDLGGYYSSEDLDKFVAVAGLKKSDATQKLPSVADISISKDDALSLAFDLKKRYAKNVIEIYPQVVGLHPHCQGALLSLIFNRGHNNIRSSSRSEMGDIQDELSSGRPEKVPALIRSMKRVWEGKNLGGLLKRRDREADLFEEGLKCNCWE